MNVSHIADELSITLQESTSEFICVPRTALPEASFRKIEEQEPEGRSEEMANIRACLQNHSETRNFPLFWGRVESLVSRTAAANGFQDCDESRAIALMHSELSELLEATRVPEARSEKIPEFTAREDELADLIIRAMAYARAHGLRLPQAIIAKAIYNTTRPYKHGKKF